MKATEPYFPVVLFIMLYKMVQTLESMDETPKCDHSNESYGAVLSCGVVQCGYMFWVHGWNPEVTSLVINSVGPHSLVLHSLVINWSNMIWILQIVLSSDKQLASLRMMHYSRKWHRHTRKKEIQVLLSGVEPKTFRLLVRMLYHWATGDSRELRPLN